LSGRATNAGIARFRERIGSRHPGWFRTALGLWAGAQGSLQVERSTPGGTTALVGVNTPAHIHAHLASTSWPHLPADQLAALVS
jgi:hypothetical protein